MFSHENIAGLSVSNILRISAESKCFSSWWYQELKSKDLMPMPSSSFCAILITELFPMPHLASIAMLRGALVDGVTRGAKIGSIKDC